MTKQNKLIQKILMQSSTSSIVFDELKNLLHSLGFEERIRGDHHIFRKAGIKELINIQKDGKHVKSYQLKQVRTILLHYNLVKDFDV